MPRLTRERRELFAALVIVLGVGGVVGARRVWRALAASPTEAQCEALLDRYLEHKSLQRDPDLDHGDIARAKEEARSDPDFVVELASCREQLTAAEVECGVAATNADDLERCVQ